jgi:hypothetical protein
MAVERAEKSDKVAEPKHETASLTVPNSDMATAQRDQKKDQPNVIEDNKIRFDQVASLYGPQGVNREFATPLNGQAVGDANPQVKPVGDAQPKPIGDAQPNPLNDKTAPVTDNGAPIRPSDIQQQKTRLENLTSGMTPDQAAEVHKDMAAIENRKPPLDAKQVNDIYNYTSNVLEYKDGKTNLSENERNQLAGSILHNASLRTGLDQGFHNTCNVTTLERRLNITNPAEAARIVSQVAVDGEYKSNGKTIYADKASLKMDSEAAIKFGDQRMDGKRDYASQVFDQATVNDYWQRQNPPLRYSQERPTGQGDTGERLRREDGREVNGPDGKPMRQPALSADAMAEIGSRLGFKGQYIIANADVAGDHNTNGAQKVHSYQEFSDALTANKPPAIIMVNANDKLFGGTGDKGGAGGWHVVNVSDYQAGPPAKVFMTNQWGEANNKWVNVSDLYNATLPSNAGRVDDNGQGGGQGDRGQGGQGDRGQGGQGGQGGDQGGRHGWSRNDGVMREDDFQNWKKHMQLEDEQQNEHKDKKPAQKVEGDPQTQIGSLENLLQAAHERHDVETENLLRQQVESLRATAGN